MSPGNCFRELLCDFHRDGGVDAATAGPGGEAAAPGGEAVAPSVGKSSSASTKASSGGPAAATEAGCGSVLGAGPGAAAGSSPPATATAAEGAAAGGCWRAPGPDGDVTWSAGLGSRRTPRSLSAARRRILTCWKPSSGSEDEAARELFEASDGGTEDAGADDACAGTVRRR